MSDSTRVPGLNPQALQGRSSGIKGPYPLDILLLKYSEGMTEKVRLTCYHIDPPWAGESQSIISQSIPSPCFPWYLDRNHGCRWRIRTNHLHVDYFMHQLETFIHALQGPSRRLICTYRTLL